MHGVVNIDIKFSFFKKYTCCSQDDKVYAYKSLYLHCGASTKVDRVAQN